MNEMTQVHIMATKVQGEFPGAGSFQLGLEDKWKLAVKEEK